MANMDRAEVSIQKFWDRVDKSGDCWIFTGKKVGNGYGSIYCLGKTYRVHRLSWELAYGVIPDDLVVAHHCDNPACVNIDHLYVCTQAQNIQDRDARKRTAKGERSGMAVLCDNDIDRIKDMLACGEAVVQIAKWFGVHRTTIGKIKSGKNWGWHVSKPLCEMS